MDLTPADWTVDYFLRNELNCLKMLNKPFAVNEIPSLNCNSLDSLKNGQLVRFQGMLQDTYNPEYFFKTYQVFNKQTGYSIIKSGMYIDVANCQPHEQIKSHSDKNEQSQRYTWMLISTPGLNDWAKEMSTTKVRPRVQSICSNKKNYHKRSLDKTEEPMDCTEPQQKKEKLSDNNVEAGSSQLNEKNFKLSQVISKDHILNFPIPNEDGIACMVKVYQDLPYKLNEIINVIGFLSLDPCLSEPYDSEEMDSDLERQTHNPPVSLVPRLHAIKIDYEKSKYAMEFTSFSVKAERIRKDIKMILSQLLFGDEIAAEYLICHLISSVYLRRECLTLGAFSINITNFPQEYRRHFSKNLYEILKLFIEKSHFMDMTLENLNGMRLLPKKDYECNRLTSGILQLSKNTHLIIDETNLTTGQITECGKVNYKTLKDLIMFQQIPYNFQYYTMEYETDIPVLILSELKSFIPCEIQIVLKPDPKSLKRYPVILEATMEYLKYGSRLTDIRQYISTLKKATFEFTGEMTEIIQEDFVQIRKSIKTFTADNLHSLMVFSRWMSLSYGNGTLDLKTWRSCLDMEMERLSRLPNRN